MFGFGFIPLFSFVVFHIYFLVFVETFSSLIFESLQNNSYNNACTYFFPFLNINHNFQFIMFQVSHCFCFSFNYFDQNGFKLRCIMLFFACCMAFFYIFLCLMNTQVFIMFVFVFSSFYNKSDSLYYAFSVLLWLLMCVILHSLDVLFSLFLEFSHFFLAVCCEYFNDLKPNSVLCYFFFLSFSLSSYLFDIKCFKHIFILVEEYLCLSPSDFLFPHTFHVILLC